MPVSPFMEIANTLFLSGIAAAGVAILLFILWSARHGLREALFAVDAVSTIIGKIFAWAIVILTAAVSYEVFVRYVLGTPTEWAFDVSYMLYGTLFMMAGPYALARNAHVRGDFIYRAMPVRQQAWLDLVLYFLFFIPGILALCYAGYKFAEFAWLLKERSANSPNGPPLYHFKAIIPIVGVLMLLQGLAEMIRCVMAIRDGFWPQRLSDVEETEKRILEEVETKGAARGDI